MVVKRRRRLREAKMKELNDLKCQLQRWYHMGKGLGVDDFDIPEETTPLSPDKRAKETQNQTRVAERFKKHLDDNNIRVSRIWADKVDHSRGPMTDL